jgi:hypothetical protein
VVQPGWESTRLDPTMSQLESMLNTKTMYFGTGVQARLFVVCRVFVGESEPEIEGSTRVPSKYVVFQEKSKRSSQRVPDRQVGVMIVGSAS